MKTIIILTFLIVSVNCGLLNSLLDKKDEPEKPKNNDLLKRVASDLEEDIKTLANTLTGAAKKPEDNKGKEETAENAKADEEKKVSDKKEEIPAKASEDKPVEAPEKEAEKNVPAKEDGESKVTSTTEAVKETTTAVPKAK